MRGCDSVADIPDVSEINIWRDAVLIGGRRWHDLVAIAVFSYRGRSYLIEALPTRTGQAAFLPFAAVQLKKGQLAMETKTALVCGGTGGLGGGIAQALREQGVRVVATSSRADASAGVVDGVVHLDFTDRSSIAGCLQALERAGIRPDILVLNGPGPAKGRTAEVSEAAWSEAFQTLWGAPLALLRALLPPMAERGWGRVVWVTSVACMHYIPDMAMSTSLRAGLHGLVRTLSGEYAGSGVTVNAIAPGYHETDRMRQLGVSQSILDQIPAGRLGTTAEFGAGAAFLASDAGGYVTGQVLLCDGGWSHGRGGRREQPGTGK